MGGDHIGRSPFLFDKIKKTRAGFEGTRTFIRLK